MTDNMALFMAELVKENYLQRVPKLEECSLELRRLSERTLPSGDLVYRLYLVQTGYHSWLLQVFHETLENERIYQWANGPRPLQQWLRGRVALLKHLERCDYPAPRMIEGSDNPLPQQDAWTLLLTTFAEGTVNDQKLSTYHLMGKALGKLHQLPLASTLGVSCWQHPTILAALKHTEMMMKDDEIPGIYQDLAQQFAQTFDIVLGHMKSLPETIVHGDIWTPNVVLKDDEITLIDWELAGRGPAVLDLGIFLVYGQCGEDTYFPSHVMKDRIDASIQGYRQWRTLSDEEIAVLEEAVQLATAWRAIHLLERAHQLRWPESLQKFVEQAQWGYRHAEEIAGYARSAFEL